MKKRIVLCLVMAIGINWASWAQMTDLPVRDTESLWASSVLVENWAGRRVEYGPEALFDGDDSTCWVEAVNGPGLGENVLILCQGPVDSLKLVNGFASDAGLFQANNRLKTLKISIVAGLTAPGMVSELDTVLYKVIEEESASPLGLADVRSRQRFDFPISEDDQYGLMLEAVDVFRSEEPFLYSMICRELDMDPEAPAPQIDYPGIIASYGFYAMRLTIDSVYPGTHYDDTCLAEVSLEIGRF